MSLGPSTAREEEEAQEEKESRSQLTSPRLVECNVDQGRLIQVLGL